MKWDVEAQQNKILKVENREQQQQQQYNNNNNNNLFVIEMHWKWIQCLSEKKNIWSLKAPLCVSCAQLYIQLKKKWKFVFAFFY